MATFTTNNILNHPDVSCLIIPAPVAAPINLQYSATTDSLTFTWDEIPCGSRGGSITSYDYTFDLTPGSVTRRSEAFDQLTACTNYNFKVKGVNSASSGPYTSELSATTATEGLHTMYF